MAGMTHSGKSRLGKGPLRASLRSLCVAAALLTATAFADSNARMVRLTDVQGSVSIDRNDGNGGRQAFREMPVPAGFRIATAEDGRAEVEFEEGSVLRMVGSSSLTFTQMKLLADGERSTVADLESGEVYFDLSPNSKDRYGLDIAGARFTPRDGARLRITFDGGHARIGVLAGKTEVERDGLQMVEVRSNETLSLDLNDPSRYYLASGADQEWDDAWVERRSRELPAQETEYQREAQYANDPYGNGYYGGEYGLDPMYGFGMGYGYGYSRFYSNPWAWNSYSSAPGYPTCGSYFFDPISGLWYMNATPAWGGYQPCYNYQPNPVYWYPRSPVTSATGTPPTNPTTPTSPGTGHPPIVSTRPTGTPTGNGFGHPAYVLNEDKNHGKLATGGTLPAHGTVLSVTPQAAAESNNGAVTQPGTVTTTTTSSTTSHTTPGAAPTNSAPASEVTLGRSHTAPPEREAPRVSTAPSTPSTPPPPHARSAVSRDVFALPRKDSFPMNSYRMGRPPVPMPRERSQSGPPSIGGESSHHH